MKSVVAEALRGKKNTAAKKENTIKVTPSISRVTNHPSMQEPLESIIRPNYQNRNVEKRLSVLNQQQNDKKSSVTTVKPVEGIKPLRPSVEDSISNLRKVSLSQGKPEAQHHSRSNQPQKAEKAQLLGSTKDGTSVWFYPTVHSHLAHLFHRKTSGYSVAVVGSKACYPSQLILLNDLLNTYPDLKYHLTWSKDNHHRFSLELYDNNANRLEKIAKELLQQFNKRSLKCTETYQITSPSAWLSKQLGITKTVEMAGILEGLSYHHYLLLLDQYLKGNSDTSLGFQVEENYLLLTGNSQQISHALANFKKTADHL